MVALAVSPGAKVKQEAEDVLRAPGDVYDFDRDKENLAADLKCGKTLSGLQRQALASQHNQVGTLTHGRSPCCTTRWVPRHTGACLPTQPGGYPDTQALALQHNQVGTLKHRYSPPSTTRWVP